MNRPYDEEDDDEDGGDFFDHLFNAIGHATRAVKSRNARASDDEPKKRKFKRAPAFDGTSPADECCTAKRE